jgi:hypothetical protein
MKLIEVVVLAGAHCISPVQQTGAATEVAKVQCAVVIEKDTQAGTLRIVPAGSSREPQVVAVLERLDREESGTFIAPASAPPGPTPQASPPETTQLPATGPKQQIAAEPTAADTAPSSADPVMAAEAPASAEEPAKAKTAEEPAEAKTAEAKKPDVKKTGAKKAETGKAKTAAKTPSKCLGEAKPKWYTAEDGRRKYRCVLPG